MKSTAHLKFIFALVVFFQMQASSQTFYRGNKLFVQNKDEQAFSKSAEPRLTMVVFHAGFVIGGKNSSYYFKAKSTILDKVHLDASMFYRADTSILYNANIAYGKVAALTVGVEFGDRFFYPGKDSTLVDLRFKNANTGNYAVWNDIDSIAIHQNIPTYAFGLSLRSKRARVNYWRDRGRCWEIFDFKFEGLFAPIITYPKQIFLSHEGLYETVTEPYDIENVKLKHWGFRMCLDARLSSKISITEEFGMRPGIRTKINEQGTFSNGYLKFGIAITIGVGGRKVLNNMELKD